MSPPLRQSRFQQDFDYDDAQNPCGILLSRLFVWLVQCLHSLREWLLLYYQSLQARPRETLAHSATYLAAHTFTLSHLFVVIWIYLLLDGEIWTFERHAQQCQWSNWEQWPEHAHPHHLAFVTDPQLVDPHTYPGRPWPLSTLSMKHTDVYLRRSFSNLYHGLDPDTIMFLGDLFDGGREWGTVKSESPEAMYHKYRDRYWQKEYRRFSRIFFRDLDKYSAALSTVPLTPFPQPRIIASLPGNHDLGFSTGIQLPVRERFHAYFGPSNRIDIIGNHTFVSLDTVSLSARDHGRSAHEIWEPADTFLSEAQSLIASKLHRHFQYIKDTPPAAKQLNKHNAVEADGTDAQRPPLPDYAEADYDIPTILLTHVPLYRTDGTPCGPLRERHPPTEPPPGQEGPVDPDEPNALPSWGAGYQYQNVLSLATTKFIIERLGGMVGYAFSGDDHDYCDVVHRAFPSPGSGIREITVKTISYAMGIRHPGFLLVSLWNEVDSAGKKVHPEHRQTLQAHLCLMPDQIGILINYGCMLGFTLFVLLLHATVTGLRGRSGSAGYLLPTSRASNGTYANGHQKHPSVSEDVHVSHMSGRFAPAGRFRPADQRDSEYDADLDKLGGKPYSGRGKANSSRAPRTRLGAIWGEFVGGTWRVARIVVPVFLWFVRYR